MNETKEITVDLTTSTGAMAIWCERFEQITRHGWSDAHDDEHYPGEMIEAALCYLRVDLTLYAIRDFDQVWPWQHEFWKPSDDPVKNLAKAGALIAAEIDRILRERAKEQQ